MRPDKNKCKSLCALVFLAIITSLINSAEAGFYSPVIRGELRADSNITFSVRNSSAITQPIVYFRQISSIQWQSCALSAYPQSEMNCTVSQGAISGQGVYEYYFNSTQGRFPGENATLKVALSERNSQYASLGELFATNSSEDPGSCNQWSQNYFCNYETSQSAMIESYWTASRATNNATYGGAAYNFTLSRLEIISAYSTCDHTGNDFDCESVNSNDPNKNTNPAVIPLGSMRQASLISSLWAAVQYGANESVRSLALSYTQGRADDCNVWNSTFGCTNIDSQGAMIAAYWKAYEMTGNGTIFEVAKNLTDYGYSMNGTSPYLAGGMWKAYELTGNVTYREKAENLTIEGEISRCVGGNCSALNLSLNAMALLTAYRVNGDSVYANYSQKAVTSPTDPLSSCNPWNNEYVCSSSNEQGAMIYMLWNAYGGFAAETRAAVELSAAKDVLNTGEYVDANCQIKNNVTGGSSIYNVNMTLFVSGGLEISGNTSYYFDEIPSSESGNGTWSVLAASPGTATLRCEVKSDNGWIIFAEKAITINAPAQPAAPGGGGGGGQLDIPDQKNESRQERRIIEIINETVAPKKDTMPPKVSLISPQYGEVIRAKNATIIIEYYDESVVNCSAIIDGIETPIIEKNAGTMRFFANDLKNGTHDLLIVCADSYNNTAEIHSVFHSHVIPDGKKNEFFIPYLLLLLLLALIAKYRNEIKNAIVRNVLESRLDRMISKAEGYLAAEDMSSFSRIYPEIQKEYAHDKYRMNPGKSYAFSYEARVYLILKMSKKLLTTLDKNGAERLMSLLEKLYRESVSISTSSAMKDKIDSAYNELRAGYTQ